MDALTHIFLPLTAVYVLFPEVFQRRRHLTIGGLGLLPDCDKFLGIPGLLHSLASIVPLCVLLLVLERRITGSWTYSPIAVLFILSHLLLDLLDGGPVPSLFPFVMSGLGFHYPIEVFFGEGLLGITFQGPIITLTTARPRPGYNTYGFITSFGVTSLLLFFIVSGGWRWREYQHQ